MEFPVTSSRLSIVDPLITSSVICWCLNLTAKRSHVEPLIIWLPRSQFKGQFVLNCLFVAAVVFFYPEVAVTECRRSKENI